MSMHSFVLQTGGLNILIDTCNGNHKSRTGIMAVFTFDPTRKTLLLQDAQPVQNAFAKAIKDLRK